MNSGSDDFVCVKGVAHNDKSDATDLSIDSTVKPLMYQSHLHKHHSDKGSVSQAD